MSGALIELVSTGVQDAYITGNPEVSFFRQTYKRHTNFASKPVRLNPIGSLQTGSTISLKIPSKGDLLSHMWIDLGTSAASVHASGIEADSANPAIFELYIGGQLIDRQDATFVVHLWHKFLADSSAKPFALQTNTVSNGPKTQFGASEFIPLQFFFCNGSCNLPLVALQYHEVEVKVTFSSLSAPPSDITFWAHYILLDTTERKMIVDKPMDILIEQVQKIPFTGTLVSPNTNPSRLKFELHLLNHPVKCLIWTDVTSDALKTENVQLYLNGTEVFETRMPDRYFSHVQSYYGSEFGSDLMKGKESDDSGFCSKMYSFALKPSKHQPTGSCNFSRLDSAILDLPSVTGASTTFNLYAINFNILRINSGLSGLAFSN